MNKKIIGVIGIIFLIVAGIGAYLFLNKDSKKDSPTSDLEQVENKKESDEKNINSNKNTVVIYFSQTGTTKEVANYISEITASDIIEIIPKQVYTSEDLNYNKDDSRANKEQNDSSARPEIKNSIDVTKYDTIYLGYPIWWGTSPKIILTFLDNYDLSDKTVIPFCTSGGSGIGTSVSYFKNNYKNINWMDGRRLTTSKNEIKEWVDSLK